MVQTLDQTLAITSEINKLIELELVHEIHTSERKSFRSCRRRWDWLYRQHYYPRVTAKALEFGVAYHVGMEFFYRPETWRMPDDVKLERAIQEFTAECDRQRDEALKAFDDFEYQEQINDDYTERVELGIGMLRYFVSSVHPKEDVNLTPVKVEIEFLVPIPNPETGEPVIWCKCNACHEKWFNYYFPENERDKWPEWYFDHKWAFAKGLPVVYGGRLDMLAIDQYNNYWIVDWKNAASIRENKEFLLLDDQIGTYVWALRKLGLNVVGFIYHEQFKGFPGPPKKNQRVREGRQFSVDKNQATDYETYLRTVSREDTDAWAEGKYDDMLAYLRAEGRKFYDRRQVPKTDDEIRSIEENIGLEALDMLSPNIRLYPSAGRFSCDFCAYREPCIAKNNRDDYKYTLDTVFVQKEHYYLDKRLSTETQGGE